MKKPFLFILTLFCSLALTACGNHQAPSLSVSPSAPVSQDISLDNIGTTYNPSIWETSGGYYYNAASFAMALRYHDKTTQKDIYLCNKPECTHNGNELCVATNSKYTFLGMQLYSGHLYINALQKTEDTMEFKLLEVSLDGSQLTELFTYYTTPSFSSFSLSSRINTMVIHRNKVIIQLYLTENEKYEKNIYYGTIICDLETHEVTSMYPDTLSTENPEWFNTLPFQDYVYYVVKENRKKILHRYHLTENRDETLDLVVTFNGSFLPFNDKIYYFRPGSMWAYDFDTQTNEQLDFMYSTKKYPEDITDKLTEMDEQQRALFLEEIEADENFKIFEDHVYEYQPVYGSYQSEAAQTDGEYLYIFEAAHMYVPREPVSYSDNYYHVYDKNLQEIALVKIPSYYELTGEETDFSDWTFRFLGDTIYVYQANSSHKVFRISREDFLSGKQNYELAYAIQWTKRNTTEIPVTTGYE